MHINVAGGGGRRCDGSNGRLDPRSGKKKSFPIDPKFAYLFGGGRGGGEVSL